MSKRNTVNISCACGRCHVIDATDPSGDERGELVVLAEGWGPIRPNTLRTWAKTGRLRAFTVERGKLVAWSRDIRDAVEAEPLAPRSRKRAPAVDPQEQALEEALAS